MRVQKGTLKGTKGNTKVYKKEHTRCNTGTRRIERELIRVQKGSHKGTKRKAQSCSIKARNDLKDNSQGFKRKNNI